MTNVLKKPNQNKTTITHFFDFTEVQTHLMYAGVLPTGLLTTAFVHVTYQHMYSIDKYSHLTGIKIISSNVFDFEI